MKIPKDFPVRPLKPGEEAKDRVTCGTCGLSWDDAIPTTWTPAPSARCPFEYFHADESEAPQEKNNLEAELKRAFPGLVNGNDDVNGGDLVDWLSERLGT